MARNNAASTRLTRADNILLRPESRNFYVFMRFRRTRSGFNEYLVGKGNASSSTAGYSVFFDSATNRLDFRVNASNDTTQRAGIGTASGITDTVWHTLVCGINRDAGQLEFWVDGVAGTAVGNWNSGSVAGFGSIANTDLLALFATHSNLSHFQGDLCDVGILKARIPTAAERARFDGGEAFGSIFRGWGVSAWWPLAGDNLQEMHAGGVDYILTNASTTEVANPTPWTWAADDGDYVEIASDDFAGASASLAGRTPTVGGTWTIHGSYTGAAFETTGSGSARRPSGDGDESLAYPNTSLEGRVSDVRATIARTGNPTAVAGVASRIDPAAKTHAMLLWSPSPSSRYTLWSVESGISTRVAQTAATTFPDGASRTFRLFTFSSHLVGTVDGNIAVAARTSGTTLDRVVGGRAGIYESSTAGDGSNVWTYDNFVSRRYAVRQVDLAVGTSGGNSGDSYAAYHLPAIAVTRDWVHYFGEARGGTGADLDPCSLIYWRAPRNDPTAVGSPTILAATATGAEPHNPHPLVHTDGVTISVLWAVLNPDPNVLLRETTGAFYRRSTDQGATWGSPVDVTSGVDAGIQAMWTPGPGHGLVLPSGRWVVPMYDADGADSSTRLYVAYTDNNGSTWTRTGYLIASVGAGTRRGNEAKVIRRSDGTLLLQTRIGDQNADDSFGRWFLTSADDGATWSTKFQETELQIPEATGINGSIHNGIAPGWGSGQVLYTLPGGWTRTRPTLRQSTDGGTNWDAAGKLIDATGVSYTDVNVLDSETALVLYNAGNRLSGTLPTFDRLTLAVVPRSWTGLPGPSSGGGFVLLGNGFL
jgi:hypothetical protein